MIYTKTQADQAKHYRERPYPSNTQQVVAPVPVPVKPADKACLGDWGWCGTGEGKVPELVHRRHFQALGWQVWQLDEDAPKIGVCETCALRIMEVAGYGSRLPYETEIPEELGGRYCKDGTTLAPPDRSDRAKPTRRITDIRLGIISEALECGPLTWGELLALKDEGGEPLFPSLNSLRHFMRTHMKGAYHVRGRGKNASVSGYPSLQSRKAS